VTLPPRIGKYRVIARLGQGGMARVLLCMSSGVADFTKLLVVKQLRDELAAEPEFLTMFLDEARLAARLNHPNVVQTYEVGEDGDSFFIAMDYLEGQPLNAIHHRVGRDKVPIDIHLRVLADMLAGLHYAHELHDYDGSPLNVVHRDVSPHNVFVTYEGQVKLVDFGIAKAAGAANLTKEGAFKGKVNYIAPEQARGDKVDRRADVFSVGVMLWEALAEKRIALNQNELWTLSLRLHGEDPPIDEAAPTAPAELRDICKRAMAPAPGDRYESAEAFREAIDGYLDGRGRVTHKDVATFMTQHFAADRKGIRATIEQQVRLHSDADSTDRPPIVTIDGAPPSIGHPGAVPSEDPTQLSPPSELTPSAVQSQRRFAQQRTLRPVETRRSTLGGTRIAVGVLAIGIGGALALFLARKEEVPVAAADASPASAPASSPAAGDERVALELAAEPANAKIVLDGAAVAQNPFRASVVKDGSMHRVQVSAEGYRTSERLVAFDRDLSLTIALEPAPAPSASASAPAAAPAAAPVAGPRHVARPGPAPKPAEPDPAAPPPVRPIDETDPYKK
jgi:serine/threonine protein kinase